MLQNQNLRRVLGASTAKRRLTGKGAQVIRKACATIHNYTVQRQNKTASKTNAGEFVISWLRKMLPRDMWNSEILQL